MFKSNNQNVYISSKSQSVKPDVVSDVQAQDQIRLLVPSFISFLDPNETYLKLDLQINNARGIIVPDHKGGVHSLFRNVIIRDGANSTTLESYEDYNAQACMMRPFTHQSSIRHKQELFEGVQKDANNSGSSLYYDAPQSLAGATDTAPMLNPRASKKIQIYTKLRSGLFGGGIVPIALLSGLRIQIDTEDPARCLQQDFIGGSEENGIKNAPKVKANLAEGDIGKRDGADADNNIGKVNLDITCGDSGANNPFAINDIVYLNHDNAGNDAFTNEVKFGVVRGFYLHNGNQLGLSVVLQTANNAEVPTGANFTTANNSVVYYKVADRINQLSVMSAANLTNATDSTIPPVSYTLSNIEMLCSAVQPPPAYVEGMLKKSLSDQGVSLDYMTSELHRFNQVNTSGLVQVQIPTLAMRAKAVFCQPLPLASSRSLAGSSLSGAPDNARNYQFVKGSELIPSRLVNLQRYSQAIGSLGQRRNEPVHTSELQKALSNVGAAVFSLQKIADSFVIARSFNKYGQITNLADDTLSLRVDYDAGQEKIFNNYVYKLARLTIANGQVSVVS